MASKPIIALVREHLKNGTINMYIEDLREQMIAEKLGPEQTEQIVTQTELEVAIAMRDGTFKEEG
jgi:hypothetical protein